MLNDWLDYSSSSLCTQIIACSTLRLSWLSHIHYRSNIVMMEDTCKGSTFHDEALTHPNRNDVVAEMRALQWHIFNSITVMINVMKRASLRHTMHASHLILSSPITLWKLLRYTLTFSLLLNWILHRNSPVVSWSSCTKATDVYKFAKSFKILLIARILLHKRRSKRIGTGLQLDNLQLQLDSYADGGEPSEFKCGGCAPSLI